MPNNYSNRPPKVAESTSLSTLQQDSTRGSGDLFSRGVADVAFDYTTLDIKRLHQLFYASEVSNIQMGTGVFRPIVMLAAIAEMGIGFTVQIVDAEDNPDLELSKFVNNYIKRNRSVLFEACVEKTLTGASYLLLTPSRKLEAMSRQFVEIDTNSFDTTLIEMARVRQVVRRFNPDTLSYVDVNVTREFTKKTITYEAKCEEADGFNAKVKIDNALQKVPFVLYNNERLPGFFHGQGEFYTALPYAAALAAVLERGREGQAYHGRPILQITGIVGSARNWIKENLGIDLDSDTQTDIDDKLIAFFKRHKFFAFGDGAEASFVESKYPTGATEELTRILIKLISTASMTPEFMFGYVVESANASIREQHVPFQMKMAAKRMYFETMMDEFVQMVLQLNSLSYKVDKDVSMAPLVKYDPEAFATGELRVKVTFKPFLTSDGRLQLDTIKMLRDAGALSATTMLQLYEDYVDDPEEEIKRVDADTTFDKLQPAFGQQGAGDVRRSDRARKDSGTAADNSAASGEGVK